MAASAVALTTGAETLTGGSGNDTFVGGLTTVSSLDVLNGGDGVDTANLEISNDLANTFTTSSVELINLTAYGAKAVDMTKMTGVAKFNIKDSTGLVTLNAVNSATMAYSFEGTSTNQVNATYKAGTLIGTADNLSVALNSSAAVAVTTSAGFETASITVTGTSDIDTWSVPGAATVTLQGSGNLDIATGLMTGISTLNGASYTGNLTTGTVQSTGFVNGTITGSSAGTVIILGSGADNIGVVDASAATYSTTVKLGAGNDKLVMNASGTAMYVFGEAGDDDISVSTSALTSADVIDGGAGTDTVRLNGTLANNAMVMKNVENVRVSAGTAAQTFTNTSGAVAVTYSAADDTNVNLVDLSAGSTVVVNYASGKVTGTDVVADVTVGFKNTEASTTVDINTDVDGDIIVSKVTAVTLDFSAVSTLAGGKDVDVSDATSLTITSVKDLDLGAGIKNAAVADALKTLTITGSGAVDAGDAIENSDKLETITITAADAKALTVGDIVAAKELDKVTLSGKSVALGRIGNTTAADDITSISVTALNGDITAADATDKYVVKGKAIGTITMSAAAGSITATDDTDTTPGIEFVLATDSTGITVDLTAKTAIKGVDSGTDDFLVVQNTGGNITASLAGTADAIINYTTVTTGVVALTSTTTGSVTTTITNAGTANAGETSTITLGNAGSGKTNTITMNGYVDTLNITGGTGKDVIAFDATGTDSAKNGTIELGGGSEDTIDFTNFDVDNSKGLAMNFTSSTVYFGQGYANATTLASSKVAAYDAAYYDGSSTAANKAIIENGQNFTVSGAEIITGTAVADYIAVANTGMTVTGLAGADKIILNAGADKVAYTAITQGGALQKTSGSAVAVGGDTITSFTTTADDFQFNAASIADSAAAAVEAQNGWDLDENGIAIASFKLDFTAGTTTAGAVSTAIGTINADGAQTGYIAIESNTTAGLWNIFQVTTSASRTGAALTLDGASDGIAHLGSVTVIGTSGAADDLVVGDFVFV